MQEKTLNMTRLLNVEMSGGKKKKSIKSDIQKSWILF